jgi:predicted ATPase
MQQTEPLNPLGHVCPGSSESRHDRRVYVAELWRVKGELLHGKARASKSRKGPAAIRLADAADACVRRALDIARQQEARSLELRSALSLTRVAVGAAETRARELLRSVYASFTEGFDTEDLQDAKALLSDWAD